ncbi:DNA polymerase III subunit delta [Candidatus Erwinia haradaeae]|uniref:DNA polymerase III subunit delta n=1 Tax=Candidatus Erwinia haradaeae TaxID=1922217 RepID=A0A451DCQ0_9GAMM|nr:DNA polymerase III subunit delta [Candidatus Erwinia haradaeae]VFP84216.1 DNA polymerase III subunit delta [Candidatus Erwinia haradaeae]
MIRIYPEQLSSTLERELRACYVLHGNEPLLLEEAQNTIFSIAQEHGFTEHFIITLNYKTDWQCIFSNCQSLSLFGARQIFLLILPEQGPTSVMSTQLVTLSTFLHRDILLILKMTSLTKIYEKSNWYQALCMNGVEVPCQKLNHKQLSLWITSRAKLLNIDIDNAANQLLCYYYEGNLLALSQVLEQICIVFPNRPLMRQHIEKIVNDAAHFNVFQWIDALLLGDSQRAIHILHQISAEDSTPITLLLRMLQRDILLLITIIPQMDTIPLYALFKKYGVLEKRRTLLSIALKRLAYERWFQICRLLTHIEITIKQHDDHSVWLELEMLTLMFCHTNCSLSIDDIDP